MHIVGSEQTNITDPIQIILTRYMSSYSEALMIDMIPARIFLSI